MRLALVVALATAEVKVETKPKPCKKFKCYGRKDPAPRSPYFAPRGSGACPEGASEHLAKCCAERDACATICGITEEACTKVGYSATCESARRSTTSTSTSSASRTGRSCSDWPWRGGCSWHSEEQKKACRCEARKDAEERRRQTLAHIYKRYDGDVSKVDELLIKADTPSKFAQLVLRLSQQRSFRRCCRTGGPRRSRRRRRRSRRRRLRQRSISWQEAAEDAAGEDDGEC